MQVGRGQGLSCPTGLQAPGRSVLDSLLPQPGAFFVDTYCFVNHIENEGQIYHSFDGGDGNLIPVVRG
jgi:hypothetical protein